MEEYTDKNGKIIKAGMVLQHDDGDKEKVYETIDGDLGFNASNEQYSGFSEHTRELYPLYQFNLKEWVICETGE